MITNIEEYFLNGCGRCERFATSDCSTKQWHSGLTELRKLCNSLGLVETVKWGHPCYMHSDRNIAIIGAFRTNFRLSFFNAALLKDPNKVLEKQGPNTQHPDMMRFTGNSEVKEKSEIIRAYLQEAMTYAEKGIKPPQVNNTLKLPEVLLDVLSADSELSEAFYKLTPGRQKSYVIHLNSAKKIETQLNRIQKFRSKIIEGKGANEQ